MSEKIDRTTVNGKPYFGFFFGRYFTYNSFEELENRKKDLKDWQRIYFKEFEIRHEQWIDRQNNFDPMGPLGTIALKFLAWGRAYKIMRLIQKKR